jgi:CheY-like chemotaxis protein
MGLRTLLEGWGYETIVATSTEQALERLRASERTPDFIMADYRLREGKVGTNAIAEIRRLVGTLVPAIVLTGETGLECRRDAERLGIGVILKPATARILDEVLSRVFVATTHAAEPSSRVCCHSSCRQHGPDEINGRSEAGICLVIAGRKLGKETSPSASSTKNKAGGPHRLPVSQ